MILRLQGLDRRKLGDRDSGSYGRDRWPTRRLRPRLRRRFVSGLGLVVCGIVVF